MSDGSAQKMRGMLVTGVDAIGCPNPGPPEGPHNSFNVYIYICAYIYIYIHINIYFFLVKASIHIEVMVSVSFLPRMSTNPPLFHKQL